MNINPTLDGVLRRYLLGTTDSEVREDVERRLFSDDRIFWEQLCLAEDELIDAYATGDLDDEEIQRFEECFLTTEERREKLTFARALKAHVDSERKAGSRAWRPFSRRLLVPSWAAAAAALLLLVLPVLTWQMGTPNRTPTDVREWLSSGLVRSVGGELKRVQIPPGTVLVRLRLELDGTEYPSYRAALHQASGDEVWSQNNLNATAVDGREAIELTLPADLLQPGDYYVRLRGAAPQKDPVVLDRYDFRVLPYAR